MLSDLRYGVRMLAKNPGFSAVAILVLALGIGANSAIFSLVNAMLLKPLPIARPGELAGIYSEKTTPPGGYRAFSYPNYQDLRDSATVFTGLAAHSVALVGVGEGTVTRRVFADIVSANYFETFGSPLTLGRAFTPAEEEPDASLPVVIVSHADWERGGRNPDILGDTLQVNGDLLTVVGVAGEGFTGSSVLVAPDLWLPLGLYGSTTTDLLGSREREPDLPRGHAAASVGVDQPDDRRTVLGAGRPHDGDVGCRAAHRVPEPCQHAARAGCRAAPRDRHPVVAWRRPGPRHPPVAGRGVRALGAGRRRGAGGRGLGGRSAREIDRDDSAVLDGGVRCRHRLVGGDRHARVLSAGHRCLRALSRVAAHPQRRPERPEAADEPGPPGWSRAAGAAQSADRRAGGAVAGAAHGGWAVPAWRGRGVHGRPGVRVRAGTAARDRPESGRLRRAARSCSLPGAARAPALAAGRRVGELRLVRDIHDRRARLLPVARVVDAPGPRVHGRGDSGRHSPGGGDRRRDAGTGVVAGRRCAWPADPLSGRVDRAVERPAVGRGLAPKRRNDIFDQQPTPTVYVPFGWQYRANMNVHVRLGTGGREAAQSMLQTVRDEVRVFDARLPVLSLKTLEDFRADSAGVWAVRAGASVFTTFGALALFLAVIGLYAVKAYAVSRRTREIGIRMALGAGPSDVLWMVLRESIVLTLAGLGVGLLLSLGTAQLLASLLYEVSTLDPVVFTLAPLVLAVSMLLASYLPARRATRVLPMVALRHE